MTRRARVDAELVRRGLARSRQQAAELIGAGRVTIDGMPAAKPATTVSVEAKLSVAADERVWVSRGAHKLIGALDAFGVRVHGRRCLDAGASTGGFTEVLLDLFVQCFATRAGLYRGCGNPRKSGQGRTQASAMSWCTGGD